MGNSLRDCENIPSDDFGLDSAQEARHKETTIRTSEPKIKPKNKPAKSKT